MNKDEEIEYLKQQVSLYRYDFLTGLKGRRDFDFDIRNKFKEGDFYLCYYDVNNLHRINRDYSFAAGDSLIRQVANDIQHQSVPHTTYRTSGDEFYAICCNRSTENVDNATMVWEWSEEHETVESMIDALDKAMIAAKAKQKQRRKED